MDERETSTTFDDVAELYDRARPGYPSELVRDLRELSALGPQTRVLEIGPGTGQATVELAASGAHVVAVERGARLARMLRRKVGSVDVVVSTFESWPIPADRFDTVAAFTAWHWLEPDVRTEKVAAALKPGGMLATVTTSHVRGGSADFFEEVQACYDRWDLATVPGQSLPAADEVEADLDDVDDSPLFGPAVRRRYEQDITYTTPEYLDVLGTYSGHIALPDDRRRGLLACIGDLIDRGYGGAVTKRYLYELRVAPRA